MEMGVEMVQCTALLLVVLGCPWCRAWWPLTLHARSPRAPPSPFFLSEGGHKCTQLSSKVAVPLH